MNKRESIEIHSTPTWNNTINLCDCKSIFPLSLSLSLLSLSFFIYILDYGLNCFRLNIYGIIFFPIFVVVVVIRSIERERLHEKHFFFRRWKIYRPKQRNCFVNSPCSLFSSFFFFYYYNISLLFHFIFLLKSSLPQFSSSHSSKNL